MAELNLGSGVGSFVRTFSMLTQLKLAKDRQESQIAGQKDRLKLEQQRIKGAEATQQLQQQGLRQRLETLMQRQQVAGGIQESLQGQQGPGETGEPLGQALSPQQQLGLQAVREGQFNQQTFNALRTNGETSTNPLAQAILQQPSFFQTLGTREKAAVIPDLVRAGISADDLGELSPSLKALTGETRNEVINQIRQGVPVNQIDVGAAIERVNARQANFTANIRAATEAAVIKARIASRPLSARNQQRISAFNEILGLTEAADEIANTKDRNGVRNIDRWVSIAGGNVQRLRGLNDVAFQEYEALSQRLLDTIARERTGAVIGDNEETRFRRFVPTADARTIAQFTARSNSLKSITSAAMDQEFVLSEIPTPRRLRLIQDLRKVRGNFRQFSGRSGQQNNQVFSVDK